MTNAERRADGRAQEKTRRRRAAIFPLTCGMILVAATCGCARKAPDGAPVSYRTDAAFAAARDRCGVTVVETPAVQRCMREQGWTYRLPWQ